MEKFIGLRYATAERFCEPVPVDITSTENLDCRKIACPQPQAMLPEFYGDHYEDIEQGEDCLRLSIFTPSKTASLPVLAFLHGGSYMTGCGLYDRFDASRLAERENCVVVCISYRLGMFGFFHDDRTRNLGIKDQACALRWIKRNIYLFGGDRNRVTLMGQSAGAHSILCLIALSQQPLFNRAIIISAPFAFKSSLTMRLISRRFLSALGIAPERASVDEFLAAQNKVCTSSLPVTPVCKDFAKPRHIMAGLEKVMLIYQKSDARPFSIFGFLKKPATDFVFGIPARIYSEYMKFKGIETKVVVREWGEGMAKFGAIHFMEIPLLMGDWEIWKTGPDFDGISKEEFEAESERFMRFIGDYIRL